VATLRPPSMGQVLKQKRGLGALHDVIVKIKRQRQYLKWLGEKGYELEQVRFQWIAVEDRPCVRCGRKGKRQLDHIIPRALGGTHDKSNLQVLCKRCHDIKTKEDMKKIRLWRRVKAAMYKEKMEKGE